MDKRELYDKAKEAYYNGEPIMTDLEFDELERELGLENQGYVGTHHQKSYTVKHPFIMGSLSKVQVKEDENHNVDWEKYKDEVMSYLNKSYKGHENDYWYIDASPKYDGCSFEVVIDKMGKLVSVSTRGDGEYGKDIKHWFEDEWEKNFKKQFQDYKDYLLYEDCSYTKGFEYHVVRGECLIKKSVFNEKYADKFTLPRTFVSGVLNQDWEGTDEQKEMRKDLSWICYDYRDIYSNGSIYEIDYGNEKLRDVLPGEKGHVFKWAMFNSDDGFARCYIRFDKYRKKCDFALDGFVLKPCVTYRLQDGGRARQKDCVAVKFLPEIVDAVLKDIEWNVGKSGEYYPTGILEDVILEGKKVNRVSLANYGKIVEEGIGIGSKIKIRLSGDIIPDVIKVIERSDVITLPNDSYVDGVHLMKAMTPDEKMYIKFLNSVKVIRPDGIGEKVAEKLFELYPVNNIVEFMMDDKIAYMLDDSKSSQNIINSLSERKKTLNLPDLIQSIGYENCGSKNSLYLAKKISGIDVDDKGIPTSIIELSNTDEFKEIVRDYMYKLSVKPLVEEKSDKIPVILTGSPKECGYATKGEFLAKHTELIETTKWDECKILFTDDLNSTSSKMDKAKKKGIEIRRYE